MGEHSVIGHHLLCSIEGCEHPSRRRGWCNAHYLRWYKYGDPIAGGPLGRVVQTKSPEERFWMKVEKSEGCWLWTGATTYYGYGSLDIDGRPYRAHRFSWELHEGPIPSDLHVLHACDNPPCVRPDHLWLGTHAENMQDRDFKDRLVPPPVRRGEDANAAKLTVEQVLAIRQDTRSLTIIAAEYGVSRSNISHIRNRKSWAWL